MSVGDSIFVLNSKPEFVNEQEYQMNGSSENAKEE